MDLGVSALFQLPTEAFDTLIDFCAVKDQLTLSHTCRYVRQKFEGKSFQAAFLAEGLRSRRKAIFHRLLEGHDPQTPPPNDSDSVTRNSTLALFLKHEYSFDGEREINPLHLRGSDALLVQAVREAFPKAVCSTREAFLHYKRAFSEFENAGELNVVLGVNDRDENLKIVQAITPTKVWENPPQNTRNQSVLTVKEEYRRFLPGKFTRMLYSSFNSSFESNEYQRGSGKRFCKWPFFRTFFAIRPQDKRRVFRHRNLPGTAFDHNLGNEGWQTEATWYRSACLLIRFPHLEETLEQRIMVDWAQHQAVNPGDDDPEELSYWEEKGKYLEEIDKLVFCDDRFWKQWQNVGAEYL